MATAASTEWPMYSHCYEILYCILLLEQGCSIVIPLRLQHQYGHVANIRSDIIFNSVYLSAIKQICIHLWIMHVSLDCFYFAHPNNMTIVIINCMRLLFAILYMIISILRVRTTELNDGKIGDAWRETIVDWLLGCTSTKAIRPMLFHGNSMIYGRFDVNRRTSRWPWIEKWSALFRPEWNEIFVCFCIVSQIEIRVN